MIKSEHSVIKLECCLIEEHFLIELERVPIEL